MKQLQPKLVCDSGEEAEHFHQSLTYKCLFHLSLHEKYSQILEMQNER